ncbi:MAG: class III extradiol ring-cleavage dioxygenase [Leptothrix sp. (in: b-proteobacteria)]
MSNPTAHPAAALPASHRALPPLYLSHGSPMIAIERSPASDFLDRLGPAIDATFGRPRAVVIVSPHSSTRAPMALAGARHEAIHDFGGFPDELFQQRYDAPGAPALAAEVAQRLSQHGVPTQAVDSSGLDHGIWTVMKRAWPDAELPVVPLTLVPNWTPTQQWAVGAALADLAHDGVLVIGSGSLTHNLRRFFTSPAARLGTRDLPIEPDVAAFQNWVHDRGAARDWTALLDYRRQAPGAALQHPTDEHWLPYYVAAGAAGEADPAVRIHASVDAGILAMDAYAFGPQAARLAQALN